MTPDRPTAAAENSFPDSSSDIELLRRYTQDRDDSAFRELVERHLDFVYSAARRRLAGDAHSAADVAQQVFTALARQAAKLPADLVLPGWLYTTTRHLSANWVRAEQSRRLRERTAHHMNEVNTAAPAGAEWESLRPLLDDVLDELAERDRGAILLRFFSRRSFADIGATLQLSEDAARMRVERALEKLRAGLARRGVVSTASALGGLLTQNAVVAAPAGMVAVVAGIALQGTGTLAGIIAFMTSTKFSLGLAATVVVAGVAGLASLPRAESSPAANASLPSGTVAAVVQPAPAGTATATASSAITASEGSPDLRSRSMPAASSPTVPRRDEEAGVAAAMVGWRMDRLHALVGLTPEQKANVAAIFAKESAALAAIPTAERGEKGVDARQASRNDVRAALTDPQRQKYDISPQSAGGGLRIDPDQMVIRLDQLVRLTPEQKQKATAILWDDVVEQVAAIPAEKQLSGFLWRDPVRARLRSVLSPEQQATFDSTPPYRKNR